jgi:DNA repair photolyase
MSAEAILPLVPAIRPSRDEKRSRRSPVRALPRVEWSERHGSVLHHVPLGKNDDVMGLSLIAGRGLGFCFANAPATCPREEVVFLFADTAEQLSAELSAEPGHPRAVFVSASADPFAPLTEVQTETSKVVEVLAAHGVEAWLMTRGFIRPRALRVLEANRKWVRLTIGLTTLDRGLQRLLEPLAAPPQMRLQQIAHLQSLGISVQVSLEPLVPGLTDSRANLIALLEALAAIRVRHVTAGYLSLRPGSRDEIVEALTAHEVADVVIPEFEGGPFLKGRFAPAAQYLPKLRRQRGYAALMALAASLGITVGVCRLSNPDFQLSRRTLLAEMPIPKESQAP